jgi:hypothetical protein
VNEDGDGRAREQYSLVEPAGIDDAPATELCERGHDEHQ